MAAQQFGPTLFLTAYAQTKDRTVMRDSAHGDRRLHALLIALVQDRLRELGVPLHGRSPLSRHPAPTGAEPTRENRCCVSAIWIFHREDVVSHSAARPQTPARRTRTSGSLRAIATAGHRGRATNALTHQTISRCARSASLPQ